MVSQELIAVAEVLERELHYLGIPSWHLQGTPTDGISWRFIGGLPNYKYRTATALDNGRIEFNGVAVHVY